jgi:hypothetical protein
MGARFLFPYLDKQLVSASTQLPCWVEAKRIVKGRSNVSCTIFYKGILENNRKEGDILDIVSRHVRSINAEIAQSEAPIIINFLNEKSESLAFDLKGKKIDGFFKWNGENLGDFYRLCDMFFELKPLFKCLKIDDDEGAWHEYIAQKEKCKIKLRPLSSNEIEILKQIEENEITSPTEVEAHIIEKAGCLPNNKSLLRAIVQDFIAIMGINSMNDFKPKNIVDLTNELNFWGEANYVETLEWFDFHFYRMMVVIWLSYAFTYKKIGLVKNVDKNVRGLKTSKIAASGGIESIFLNKHTGGASNFKEAEMRRFAKKYFRAGSLGEVMVIDNPERELEFLFSMMDYLGFGYVGVA